jgi:DNA-binding NtrC family response regulator
VTDQVPVQILVIDDVPANLSLLADLLEPEGYQLLVASSGEEGLEVVRASLPSLILLDVMMPDLNGYEVCRRVKADPVTKEIPVIFITARDDEGSVVEGFRAGGIDYITKPLRREEVLARVRTHLSVHRLARDLKVQAAALTEMNETLRREMARRLEAESAFDAADGRLSLLAEREAKRWNADGFVGKSRTMIAILESLSRVRDFATTTVLITGESGTGKELVARAIHAESSRARHPFVPVNCSAVPAELMESLFFGHRRGAFTGADRDKKGFFELARGGTLFLDEVGEMPLGLQAKLLRVLESGAFLPIGADREQKADVRVVAATNANLEEKIGDGRFRQDLYYRLARFTVRTPPLRERREDVPLLAEHFLRMFALEMTREPPRLGDAAVSALQAYDFPGNVRELKNIIERALIECGGREIAPEHLALPARVLPKLSADAVVAATGLGELPLNLQAAEKFLIERALGLCNGSVASAARMLGIPRMRIYRRLGGGGDSAA